MAAATTRDTGDRQDDSRGRFSRLGLTAKKWLASAKRFVLNYPYRRQETVAIQEIDNDRHEIFWREARGEYVPHRDQRLTELWARRENHERNIIESWNGDYPGKTTAPAWGRMEELLDDTPDGISTAIQEQLVPRYINEDGEFGESRPQILDRLDEMDVDAYDDPRQVAYRTDDEIRQDLFGGELQAFGYDMTDEDIDELRGYADDLKQTDESADTEKPGDVAAYEQDRIGQELAPVEDYTGDMLQHWVIPTYINESHDFDVDREAVVDQLVQDYGTHDYDDLAGATDGDVRKQLLRAVIVEDYDPALSDGTIDDIVVYAEDLRANADIRPDAEYPEQDGNGEALSDGGSVVPADMQQQSSMDVSVGDRVDPAVQETELPASYTADGYEIVNEFTTTGYNTYQKIDVGDGFAYRKNGASTSPQSYAGASAHKLPG